MTFTIKKAKRPNKQRVASVLKSLPVSDEDCAEFPINKRLSVANTMTRLKKEVGMEFESHIEGDNVLVWRVA